MEKSRLTWIQIVANTRGYKISANICTTHNVERSSLTAGTIWAEVQPLSIQCRAMNSDKCGAIVHGWRANHDSSWKANWNTAFVDCHVDADNCVHKFPSMWAKIQITWPSQCFGNVVPILPKRGSTRTKCRRTASDLENKFLHSINLNCQLSWMRCEYLHLSTLWFAF